MNDRELNVRIIFRGTGRKKQTFLSGLHVLQENHYECVCKCEVLWYVLKPNQRGATIKSLVSQQQTDSGVKSVAVLWGFFANANRKKKTRTNRLGDEGIEIHRAMMNQAFLSS